jgi:hypothetical protein
MKILNKIWKIWKRIGQMIGDLIGRLVLSIFYFTIFLPFGLGVKLFGDPLNLNNKNHQSKWLEKITQDDKLENARRLF